MTTVTKHLKELCSLFTMFKVKVLSLKVVKRTSSEKHFKTVIDHFHKALAQVFTKKISSTFVTSIARLKSHEIF